MEVEQIKDELKDTDLNESITRKKKIITSYDKNNEAYYSEMNSREPTTIHQSIDYYEFRVIMGIFTNLGPLLIYLAGGYLIIKEGNRESRKPYLVALCRSNRHGNRSTKTDRADRMYWMRSLRPATNSFNMS